MRSRAAWLELGQSILATCKQHYARFGIHFHSDLHLVIDHHPCPGYLHEELQIAFCPPTLESNQDRLQWLFFSRMMGCESVAEAHDFYECALPTILAHEAAHHVRISYQLDSESHFFEEQICDYLAIAVVESEEVWSTSLPLLATRCRTQSARLAPQFAHAPSSTYLPSLGELLVRMHSLPTDDWQRLEHIAAQSDLQLETLIQLLPQFTPEMMRSVRHQQQQTRGHMDANYTSNAAEYWYLSMNWLASYLTHVKRPSLSETIGCYLLDSPQQNKADQSWRSLWSWLAQPNLPNPNFHEDPTLRGVAVELLLQSNPKETIPELSQLLPEAVPGSLTEACLRTLVTQPDTLPLLDSTWVESLLEQLTHWFSLRSYASVLWLLRLGNSLHCSMTTVYRQFPEWQATLEQALLANQDEAATCQLLIEIIVLQENYHQLLNPTWFGTSVALGWLAEALLFYQHSLSCIPYELFRPWEQQRLGTKTRRKLLPLLVAEKSALPPWNALAIQLAIHELDEVQGSEHQEHCSNQQALQLLTKHADSNVARSLVIALPARGKKTWQEYRTALVYQPDAVAVCKQIAHSKSPITQRLRAVSMFVELHGDPKNQDEIVQEALALSDYVLSFTHIDPKRHLDGSLDLFGENLRLWLEHFALQLVLEVAQLFAREEQRETIGKLVARFPWDSEHELIHTMLVQSLPAAVASRVRSLLTMSSVAINPAKLSVDEQSITAEPLLATGLHLWEQICQNYTPAPLLTTTEDPVLTLLEKLVFLRTIPLFSGVPSELLKEIAARSVVEQFPTSHIIFEEGQPGKELFLLLQGSVCIEADGGARWLAELHPPACLGEMALFDQAPRSARARCLSPTKALCLSRSSLMRVARQEPEIYEEFLQVLSQRLRASNQQLRSIPNK
jgi:CRP/FNR family transcriptional regulator, cyclic AMP receptor protein